MALYVRDIKPEEGENLRHWTEGDDPALRHRARVILLSSQGYRIPEIGALVGAHPTNLRKWIHRFNVHGPAGLISPRSGGPPPRFSQEQKDQIISLAKQNPRELDLNFSKWTLHKLAEQARRRDIVDSISHEYVRQILADAEVAYRRPTPPPVVLPDNGQIGQSPLGASRPQATKKVAAS